MRNLLLITAAIIALGVFLLPRTKSRTQANNIATTRWSKLQASSNRAPAAVRPNPSTVRPLPLPGTRSTQDMVNAMVAAGSTDRAKQLYENRTAQLRFNHNLAAVTYTCLDRYHRDSCIHHLIQCGPACKAIIPATRFGQIEREYWSLMAERKLAQLPRKNP